MNFDIVFPDDLREIRVDGVAEVQIGLPMCRITFFQTRIGPQTTEDRAALVELREAVTVMAIPLPVMLEAFEKILKSVALNESALRDGLDSQYAAQQTLLGRVTAQFAPAAPVSQVKKVPAAKKMSR